MLVAEFSITECKNILIKIGKIKKTHTNKKNFFLHVWWGRFISVPVDEAKIDEFARWRWRAVDYFNHVR